MNYVVKTLLTVLESSLAQYTAAEAAFFQCSIPDTLVSSNHLRTKGLTLIGLSLTHVRSTLSSAFAQFIEQISDISTYHQCDLFEDWMF